MFVGLIHELNTKINFANNAELVWLKFFLVFLIGGLVEGMAFVLR